MFATISSPDRFAPCFASGDQHGEKVVAARALCACAVPRQKRPDVRRHGSRQRTAHGAVGGVKQAGHQSLPDAPPLRRNRASRPGPRTAGPPRSAKPDRRRRDGGNRRAGASHARALGAARVDARGGKALEHIRRSSSCRGGSIVPSVSPMRTGVSTVCFLAMTKSSPDPERPAHILITRHQPETRLLMR